MFPLQNTSGWMPSRTIPLLQSVNWIFKMLFYFVMFLSTLLDQGINYFHFFSRSYCRDSPVLAKEYRTMSVTSCAVAMAFQYLGEFFMTKRARFRVEALCTMMLLKCPMAFFIFQFNPCLLQTLLLWHYPHQPINDILLLEYGENRRNPNVWSNKHHMNLNLNGMSSE